MKDNKWIDREFHNLMEAFDNKPESIIVEEAQTACNLLKLIPEKDRNHVSIKILSTFINKILDGTPFTKLNQDDEYVEVEGVSHFKVYQSTRYSRFYKYHDTISSKDYYLDKSRIQLISTTMVEFDKIIPLVIELLERDFPIEFPYAISVNPTIFIHVARSSHYGKEYVRIYRIYDKTLDYDINYDLYFEDGKMISKEKYFSIVLN